MKNNSPSQRFPVSQKIYAQLLRAYPQRHREEYGGAMAQLFRDQCRDAWNESRGWGMAKLWLRVLPDLVNTSIMERLAALNERKSMSDKLANLSSFQNSPTKIFFRVFATVFLLVLIASVAITFILPETYASTARIKVESDQMTTIGIAGSPDPYFIQTTFEIIQSQLVLDPVISRLNLNVQWGKKYFAGQTLKNAETLEILKKRLSLSPIRGTKLIAITVYSDDAKEAAVIANAVADSYRDYRNTFRTGLMAHELQILNDNYQAQESQIKKLQNELISLQEKLGIPDNIEGLSANLLEREKSYQQMRVQFSQLHSSSKERLRDVLPAMVADSALHGLLDKLQEAQMKLAGLTNDYSPDHSMVVRAVAQIGVLDKQIDDRIAGVMAGLEGQLAATKSSLDELNHQIQKSKPSPETQPYWDTKDNLKQRVESQKILFAKIEAEKLDAQIPKTTLVQITDTAEPGRAPVKPNKTLNIVLGAFFGILSASVLGAVAAFVVLQIRKQKQRQSATA